MSDRLFERAVNEWLEDGSDRTPPTAIQAVLFAIKTTPQQRDLRVLRRFPPMTNLMRAAAGVAIVAMVGVGVLAFNSRSPLPGSTNAPAATVTGAPTAAAPTLPPGIPGWTAYTSPVYGFTISYPSDWPAIEPASQRWPAGRDLPDSVPYADSFANPTLDIALWVWEMAAPAGVNVGSTAGMSEAFSALCASIGAESCEPVFAPKVLCLGPLGLREPPSPHEPCPAALFAPIGSVDEEIPHAFVGDPETNVVTVFVMGRHDSFPAAAKYGGTEALLMAIVSQLGVR